MTEHVGSNFTDKILVYKTNGVTSSVWHTLLFGSHDHLSQVPFYMSIYVSIFTWECVGGICVCALVPYVGVSMKKNRSEPTFSDKLLNKIFKVGLLCVICGFFVRYISGREGTGHTRLYLLKELLLQLEDPIEMAKREEKKMLLLFYISASLLQWLVFCLVAVEMPQHCCGVQT